MSPIWPHRRRQDPAWPRRRITLLTGASLLALGTSLGASGVARAADILITNGTFVVTDASVLGGNNVIIDNGSNQGAALQIDTGVGITNSITLNSGGALVNAGAISRGAAGVTGDTGTVTNQSGGSIASSSSDGIYFSIGGTVTNAAGASISGANGIYGDWISPGTLTVTNSGTITGTATSGIDIENTGTVTNQAGGTITGAKYGVLTWGNAVTNTGTGSVIRSTSTTDGDSGVDFADVGTLINTNGAQIRGPDGVQLFNGGSVTNSNGAVITATNTNGIYITGSSGTVLNDNATITSHWWGINLDAGGTITNQNGGRIIGEGSAAVYLAGGGTVINGAGSFITGNLSGVYGIYATQAATVSNAGTITGDVRLADMRTNTVTLFAGGRINGDLYINTDATSTLTLDGTGTQRLSDAVSGLVTFVNGVLTKQGSGTWIIDKSINAFTMAVDPGSIVISAGTLQVGDGNSGANAGRVTANVTNNGTLAFNRSDNLTYAGQVSGGGNFIKYGAGTLILTGSNTYSGGTIISAGTLQIGSGGTTGSIVGNVANEGTLAFNRSNAFAFAGAISGSGAVTKSGASVLTLTGNSTFTGGTTINAGTLQIGNGGTTGSIAGNVTNNAILAFNRSGALTLGGAISGSGSVRQTGTGTTTLTGINTYTGGTAITAGTLAGSASSFGTGAIVNDGTLIVDQATDATFVNALSGTGAFIKQGSGKLSFTGTSAITSTTVTQGLLAVDGSLANATITVQSGGTLGGNGTVGAIVAQSGAVVAPGNSIGTLNVAGNYSAAAGSTYQAELASGGQSDLISATGTATITSGALLQAVRFDSGTYVVGTRYTVLTATGNVSGRYTLVNGGALTAFLSVTDEYDTNNVYLRIMQSRSLAAAGITPNQISAAGALQALPSGNALLAAALSQPDDAAARRAFDQVSGEIHASIQGMLIEDSRFLRNAALDRLRESFCVLEPARDASRESHCESEPGKTTAWATTFGSWGTHSGDGNAASLSRSIGGMIAGADTALANSWRLGFLGGYSRSSFSAGERGSSGSSDNYHFGFYGGMDRTPFAVRFGGAYTWHDIATNRTVAFSGFSDRTQAAYRAATMQAFGELGYRIPLRDVLLESYANLAIVNVQSDNFAESGGAAALAGRSSALDAGFTTLGLRASTSFRLGLSQAVLKGALGWRRALRNTTPTAVMNFSGGNNFAISGTPVARDVAVVDAGIDIAFSVNARLGLSYGGQFGSGADDQSLRGMLSVNF